MISGPYKSHKAINKTSVDKFHFKCDFIIGSIVNGVREPISFNVGLDKPPDHKINKEPRKKFFEKINKYVLSQIIFYLEDDDKPVDFNGENDILHLSISKNKNL